MVAAPCWSADSAEYSSMPRDASWGNACQPASRPLGIWSGCAPVNIGVKAVRSPATVKAAAMWWPVSIQAQSASSGVPYTDAKYWPAENNWFPCRLPRISSARIAPVSLW